MNMGNAVHKELTNIFVMSGSMILLEVSCAM